MHEEACNDGKEITLYVGGIERRLGSTRLVCKFALAKSLNGRLLLNVFH